VETRIEIEVVTPVHGGGVGWDDDAGKRHVRPVDPVTPVRGAGIRGQLRFWWRATTGCCLASIDAMRAREGDLWGAASTPGRLSLHVESASIKALPRRVFESIDPKGSGTFNPQLVRGESRDIAYGAFALQPKARQRDKLEDGVLSTLNGSATLVLSYPKDCEAEVQRALDAWLLFGGIGGRTRRGFGAVVAKDRRPSIEQLKLGARATLPLVPSLYGARVELGSKAHDRASTAHEASIGVLRGFRQGENVGRNARANEPNNKKPAGRSRWPEPEAIRTITGRSSDRHRPRLVQVDKFPRAAFGMPILFHFQDEKDGEPHDTTLKPRDFERMASPLLLRPHQDAQGWRALALVLAVPGAANVAVVLKGENTAREVNPTLTPEETARVRPLADQRHRDALSAFIAYFRSNA
jgi:CRISPR-associated protein Cmr1